MKRYLRLIDSVLMKVFSKGFLACCRFLLVSLAVLSLCTCKHKCDAGESEDGCPGCCADQSLEGMKDYYYFKTGSYWIYEEENSGEKDTVVVIEDNEGNDGAYDYWNWECYSSYYDYFFFYEYHESFSTYCITRFNCHCRKVNRSKYRPGDGSGNDNLFLYPLIVGNYNNLMAGGTSKVMSISDSLSVNGTVYYDVVNWFVENCTTEDVNHWSFDDGVPVTFEIAKQIGIVRKSVPEYSEVWNLIEYSVTQ